MQRMGDHSGLEESGRGCLGRLEGKSWSLKGLGVESELPEIEDLKTVVTETRSKCDHGRERLRGEQVREQRRVAQGRIIYLDVEITRNVEKSSLSGSEPGAKIMK